MRLAALERRGAFALLGPGFAPDRRSFLLLDDLQPARSADPLLVLAAFEARGDQVLRLAAGSISPCWLELPSPSAASLEVELLAADYLEKVRRIREAIACGDVYQVCLTARARLGRASGADLFARICRRGIPRFAAWVRLPDGRELVSASPELFFETEASEVHTEPMKGTARAGAGDELELSEKDRSELAMITDLLRNDLTPICRPGSVRVTSPRRFLQLPYAVQAVSDVVGVLESGLTPLEVLAALHPGGSVTGAPKQAALDLIGQLECTPRGFYCGALGLCSGQGSIFSLLIRTACRAPGGWIYGVGGGIVYDSDPAAELRELEVKLGALG